MVDSPLWEAGEAVAASGATLEGAITKTIHGVTIDNRAIAPGDVFVAIKGEKHDGHSFVVAALKAGAGAAMVSRTRRSPRPSR